jgi:hypothetical protein
VEELGRETGEETGGGVLAVIHIVSHSKTVVVVSENTYQQG